MENKGLKVKELIEYLNMFSEDDVVHVLLARIKERKVHDAENIFLITDIGIPVIGIEIGPGRDMDEDEVAACEEEEEGK